MIPFFDDCGGVLYHGNCLAVVDALDAQSVNAVVTSPPYWGLRDYDTEEQIGQERTPEEYVARIVELFRRVRRVLRDDGTVWLNLGDAYASHGAGGMGKRLEWMGDDIVARKKKLPAPGLKAKDLVGVPWMVAFALRADGWYLRQDNVWGKPNCMPESVEDRTTRSHEYVFLLSKSETYYYDAEAVRTAPKPSTETRLNQDLDNQIGSLRANGGAKTNGPMKAVAPRPHHDSIESRKLRANDSSKSYPTAERNGIRGFDKQRGHGHRHDGFNDRWDAMEKQQQQDGANLRDVWWITPATFKGAHFAVMPEKLAAICVAAGCPDGGTVLDPFFGTGTTGVVCQSQHVRWIGIELNEAYCRIAARRLSQGILNFSGQP